MEMKSVMAKLIEILVTVTFETHIYKWTRKVYKLNKGGLMELRASGRVAKVAIEEWIMKLEATLEELGIKVHLLRKYVDDVTVVVNDCQFWERYTKGKIQETGMSEKEDIERDRSRSEVTLDVLLQVANKLMPYLKFIGEASTSTKDMQISKL